MSVRGVLAHTHIGYCHYFGIVFLYVSHRLLHGAVFIPCGTSALVLVLWYAEKQNTAYFKLG